MFRNERRGFVLAGCVVIGLGAYTSQAELVTNGGFESGSFAPWFAPPWVLPPQPNPQYFVVSSGGAHSGNHYAILSSSTFQYISQVLPTTAGTDYELTFWLRRPGNVPSTFIVRWEGQIVFQEGILLPDNTNWWQFTVPLHSNITGSFLELGQATFPNEFHIDDISVVQVPGPGGAALFAAAGAFALRRRRR
ncbi:MAG: hypothetical protein KF699_12160 [Phycisphaeraceae bacterium]|nr:hypothetical protein [Phycisphaeraceae bacterium]MBX3407158.1 hypothetical protein [Phycisphaeraceae bacterium]